MSDLGLEIRLGELGDVPSERLRIALGLACLTRLVFGTGRFVSSSVASQGEDAVTRAWESLQGNSPPEAEIRVLSAELADLEWSTPRVPWMGHDMHLISKHLVDYFDQLDLSSLHLIAGAAIRSLEELSEHLLDGMSSEITWESKYQNVAVVQEVGNQRIDLAMATLLEADDALFAIGRRAVEQGRLRASSINRLLDGSQ